MYYYYYYFDELPHTLRLNIKIEFKSFVTSSLVSGILEVCEEVAFEIIRDDINFAITSVFGELSEEDKIIVDSEIEKYEHDALVITNNYSGSIVIEAELSHLAIWAVIAVLGISFKESWKETQTHAKIKKILIHRIGPNSTKFINYFNERIKKNKKIQKKRIEPTINFNDIDLLSLEFNEQAHPLGQD